MIGQAVREQLLATAAVTKHCKYIYPHVIPQDRTPPAITYAVDEIDRDRGLSGELSYNLARISLDVYTDSEVLSNTIADAIEAALVDYRGTLGKAASGIDCDHIRQERRFGIFETPTELYRVSLQLAIGYEDT